jgi:hypothetical protein
MEECWSLARAILPKDQVPRPGKPRCLDALCAAGGGPMDFRDSHLWYGAAGVIVILLVIAYEVWFSGIPTPQ